MGRRYCLNQPILYPTHVNPEDGDIICLRNAATAYKSTRRQNTEEHTLNIHRRDNLNMYSVRGEAFRSPNVRSQEEERGVLSRGWRTVAWKRKAEMRALSVSRKGRNITNLRLSGCCDHQKEGGSLEHVTPHAAKKGFLCFPRQARPQQAREWPKWPPAKICICWFKG